MARVARRPVRRLHAGRAGHPTARQAGPSLARRWLAQVGRGVPPGPRRTPHRGQRRRRCRPCLSEAVTEAVAGQMATRELRECRAHCLQCARPGDAAPLPRAPGARSARGGRKRRARASVPSGVCCSDGRADGAAAGTWYAVRRERQCSSLSIWVALSVRVAFSVWVALSVRVAFSVRVALSVRVAFSVRTALSLGNSFTVRNALTLGNALPVRGA